MKISKKLALVSTFLLCGFMTMAEDGKTCNHSSTDYWICYNASSYLVENTRNGTIDYEPDSLKYVGTKPWVSGKSQNSGVGESITIAISDSACKKHLMFAFRNGFQSFTSSSLYSDNTRAKVLEITNQDNGKSATVTVLDIQDTQLIDVRPLVDLNGGDVNFKIEIKEVYAGAKYKDLCIDSIVPYFADGDGSGNVDVKTLTYDKNYEISKKINTYKLFTGKGSSGPYGKETLTSIIDNAQSKLSVGRRTVPHYVGCIEGYDVVNVSEELNRYSGISCYIVYDDYRKLGWISYAIVFDVWEEGVKSVRANYEYNDANLNTQILNDLKKAFEFKVQNYFYGQ